MLAQLETALKVTDQVARQDPGWQLVFFSILIAGALIWVARYTARQNDQARAYWAERHDKLSTRLDEVQDGQTKFLQESNARMMGVLDRNSIMMGQFAETVESVKHLFAPRRRES